MLVTHRLQRGPDDGLLVEGKGAFPVLGKRLFSLSSFGGDHRRRGVNRIEQIKSERDGLDVGEAIPRYAEQGFEAIEEGDVERLKWWGLFVRKHTPGHFMMRIRIPNGLTTATQLRTLGTLANQYGRGVADITTRQQLQLRWLTIGDIPTVLERLRGVGLVTLQTGMDNIRNVVGCAVAGLTGNELFDASPVSWMSGARPDFARRSRHASATSSARPAPTRACPRPPTTWASSDSGSPG